VTENQLRIFVYLHVKNLYNFIAQLLTIHLSSEPFKVCFMFILCSFVIRFGTLAVPITPM